MFEWPEDRACKGESPSVFLPDDTGDRHLTEAAHRKALQYCRQCPVETKALCLEYALETGEIWGVWGGTTPRQRRTIRETRLREERIRLTA